MKTKWISITAFEVGEYPAMVSFSIDIRAIACHNGIGSPFWEEAIAK